jgi:hypothetical protein
MKADKESMRADKYVMAVFVSPSGNGLKALVKIPAEASNHKRYFDALQKHFNSPYFDVTSKNVSRVCYESVDRDIHINYESELWDTMSEITSKPITKTAALYTIPVTDENKIIKRLMMWWEKRYGLVEGKRNANVFILAVTFNEFGISKSLAEYAIGAMQSSDFTMSEIIITINSAYKNTSVHGSKFYEDEEELYRMRDKLNKGASSSEIKKDLRNMNLNEEAVAEVVETLEKGSNILKFWSKTEKGSISVVHFLFKEFLETNGFYKFAPHGSSKYMFVRVENNLIKKTTEDEIKDFVLEFLQNIDDLSIYNFFADKTRFFKEDFLSLLGVVNIYFVEDTKEFSHIYFKNCAVKVTKDNIEPIEYVDLDGYVWHDQVIDRDFDFCDTTECDYKKFISNVCDGDKSRIKSVESAVGYLMSSYKDASNAYAVIINDEVLSGSDPQGGTGKGLFVQGVGAMKNVSYIDGKTFSFDKSFPYQTVGTDTQIISFDDVKRGFTFETLFSVITEGITLERKNKDAIRVPFDNSPKVVITTNYTISGRGNSHDRRKREIDFKQHYSKNFTPVNDFGRRFFDEWDEQEWCVFDNYMINNLKGFLSNGFVEVESKNKSIKKLAAATNHQFIEWAGLIEGYDKCPLIKYDKKIFCDELYTDFVADNPDFARLGKHTISRTAFYRWLVHFGEFEKGVEPITGRDKLGKWIVLKTEEKNEKLDPEIQF